MLLVDSHCHLDMLAEKVDLKEVIANAVQNDVGYMQTICTTLEEFPHILAIAEKYDNVFASVGIHPNEVKEKVEYKHLVELSTNPKVIGLGETGLDYYYQTSSKELQIHSFKQHILASQETKLPIIVHTREAEEDTINIITSEQSNTAFPGLIHCFTSSLDLAKKMLDVGMYISIAGIVTFKNAESLRDVVRFVPLDRLLIETDSPYLAPVPMRGRQNEPAFVKYVADYIAELKGVNIAEVARQTTENFFTLFSKTSNLKATR